jgi:hypothetical protein
VDSQHDQSRGSHRWPKLTNYSSHAFTAAVFS